MLELVRSAADLANTIFRLTDKFPKEEKYILVPVLRDKSLAIIENVALGMARFNPSYRLIFLTRALKVLNELESQFVICKTLSVVTPADYNELKESAESLRNMLHHAVKLVDVMKPYDDKSIS